MTAGLAPLLSSADVAELLDVSERTLEFWRYAGKGPAYVKVGKRVRYRPVDVEAYVEAQRQGGDASQ
jgi:predicted site-specific integrase-resolvase